MKIAVVGNRATSRTPLAWKNTVRSTVFEVVKALARRDTNIVIVSGGAPGVDTWAEEAADLYGLAKSIHPAKWDELGRAAGPIRNALIVQEADRMIAVWDGVSRGTQSSVTLMQAAGKPCKIVPIPRLSSPVGGGS